MANIKFEVKNADPVVDLKVKTPVELAGLQAELLAKKNELLGKKTIEEATKFLEGLPIFSDDTKKLIVLGDKIMQFDSNDSKYQEALNEFKASIDEANTEIDSSKLFKEVQADNLLDSNKDIINKTQTQVINTSFFERGGEISVANQEQQIWNNFISEYKTMKFTADIDKISVKELESMQVNLIKVAQKRTQFLQEIQNAGTNTWENFATKEEQLLYEFLKKNQGGLIGEKNLNDIGTKASISRFFDDYKKIIEPTPEMTNQVIQSPENKAVVADGNSTDGKEVAKEEKKEGNKPETTPEAEKPTAVENLTPAQRDAEIKKTIAELIQNGGIKVEKVDGKAAPYAINLTQKQWQGFRKLYDLNYINTAIQEAQDGSLKISRIDKRINKLVDKAQRFAVEGKFDEATKATRKANELAQEKVRDSAEYAKLATDLANLTERYQHNVGLGSAGLAVAKQSKEFGYHGNTFAIDAYHPAFVNICKTLCVSEPQFGSIIDLGNGQQAVIDCPELRRYSNNQIDAGLRNFTPDAYNKCPSEYRQGWLEKLFLQTNMTPEQAKKNANLLTAGGIGVGLFFLGRWLFTGKGIDGKEHKAGGFFGRLGITAGSLLGINMLSQGFTGNNAMDIIKGLWYGDVKFEDLWNGKMGKERILGGRFDVANIALRDIPMVALAGCSVEAQGGGIKVNLSQLEAYLNTQLEDTKLSAERRGILEQQLEAIRSLKNDPQGEQKLQALFAEMGITYAYISDPKNSSLTLNDNFDTKSKNGQKLQEYLDKQGSKLAVPDSDPEVTAYLLFGKPTIDELAAKGKFTKLTEFEKAKDTQVVEPALLKVDQKYAPALQLALNKMSAIDFSKNNGARPGFSYENGILSLDSYGVKTPIWLDADNEYRVVGLDIPFPSAEEAVKTANLLNFIVVTYNGSATVDDPFNFIFGDIKKTDGLKTRRECFDKSKVASTIKNIFGTEVIDGDDYTLFPWTKSTIKDIGGSELAGNAGRTKLVQYLNGLKKKTDQTSIWKKGVDGQAGIVHTNEIEGWFDPATMQFPKPNTESSSSTVDNSSGNGETAAAAGVVTGAVVEGSNQNDLPEILPNNVEYVTKEQTTLYGTERLRSKSVEEISKALQKWADVKKSHDGYLEKGGRATLTETWKSGFFNARAESIKESPSAYIQFKYMNWRYQRQPGKNEPICVGLKPLPDQVDKNKNPIVNETQVQKVSVDNTVEVSDTALTIGQLQENMAKIWDKYFVKAKSFPYQRQNDFFVGSNIDEGWKLYNLPNQGVRLINTSIKIEQKVYQLSIPLTMMDSNGRIPLPEFVAKLQNDLNNKLEKAHDAILLERYLKDKYIGWDQLFKGITDPTILAQITRLKSFSKNKEGLNIKSIKILEEGDERTVKLSFDMTSPQFKWANNLMFDYSKVFSKDGVFLSKDFYKSVSKSFINGPFTSSPIFAIQEPIQI